MMTAPVTLQTTMVNRERTSFYRIQSVVLTQSALLPVDDRITEHMSGGLKCRCVFGITFIFMAKRDSNTILLVMYLITLPS